MAKKTSSKKSRSASSSAAPAVADDRKKAWGDKYRPRYTGVATFMRRPLCESEESREGVDIGVIGVPFDGGVTNRTGARHGPRHLREQSTFMGLSNHQTGVRPYDLAQVADLGDVPIEGVYRLDEAIDDIERYYDGIAAAGILPLSAGGDHSISLPILKALAKVHGQPLAMVHFDAHCDTGSELFGHKHHHGGPFRVAAEEGALDPKRTIQIGIRGPSEPLWQYSYDSGMTVIHIEKLYEMGLPAVIKKARSVVGKQPVYVSFDVDGLDPVYAPGTGTPETGGFTTFEAQQMLRGLSGLNIVGGDVVEVAPPFDPSGVTGLTGAQMMFEILCLLSQTVEKRKKPGKKKSVSKGAERPTMKFRLRPIPTRAAKRTTKKPAKPAASKTAKTTAKSAAKPTAKASTKAATKGASKPAAKSAAKTTAKSAAKPAAKASTKAAAKGASKPAAKGAAKTTAKSAAKPAAKASTKAAAKGASKPAAKGAAKTTAKSAAKPAAKGTAKAAAKGATKPATKKSTEKSTAKGSAKTTAKGALKTATKGISKATAKNAPKAVAKSAAKTTAKSAAKTAAKSASKTTAKSAAKTASKGAAKTSTKTPAKGSVKTSAKGNSKAASKTSAKGVAKPAAKGTVKSAAKPAAKGKGRAKVSSSTAKAGASAKSRARSKSK